MSSTDWNELDGYEALVSELRATAPAAPDRLRERVLDGAPEFRRRMSKKRRLTLIVVPVAVALSVGAALVHGFVSTGSRNNATAGAVPLSLTARGGAETAHGINAKQSGTTTPSAEAPATQSKLHAYSASSNWNTAADAPASSSGQFDALGAERAVAIPRNRLVHAVASLEVRVKSRSELSAKTNRASQIVGSFGGYAQSVRYQNSRNGYGESILQLRVPVQKAEAAIGELSKLGALVSQQVSTQDLQAKLNSENSGIGSLRRAITVYESALNSGTLSGSQRVIIQIRLNNARRSLSHLRHARTGTLASGATASISLLLTTRNHAVVGHHHHKEGRLGRLLHSAANFLGLEGIIVLYALIVLSPLALIAALGWWIVRERRRREERLLASA
jgi:Domain of unknown function (DUF4349)